MFSLLASREVTQRCKNSIPVIREISCVLLSLFMSIYISRKARRMELVDMNLLDDVGTKDRSSRLRTEAYSAMEFVATGYIVYKEMI